MILVVLKPSCFLIRPRSLEFEKYPIAAEKKPANLSKKKGIELSSYSMFIGSGWPDVQVVNGKGIMPCSTTCTAFHTV